MCLSLCRRRCNDVLRLQVIVARPGWGGIGELAPKWPLRMALFARRAPTGPPSWQDASSISVEYLRAKHESVTEPLVSVAGQQVATSLHAGVEDPTAKE
jgi:hypothetical protein